MKIGELKSYFLNIIKKFINPKTKIMRKLEEFKSILSNDSFLNDASLHKINGAGKSKYTCIESTSEGDCCDSQVTTQYDENGKIISEEVNIYPC